jgi:twitching motility protein PilJ
MSTASDATKTGKLRLGGSNLWLFLLLASMILFGVNTGVATWQGSRLADAGSKAADLQVLSQQLANQGRDAVGGNAQAFTAFKATRNAIEQNVSTLQGRYGKEPGVSGAIATLGETWAPLGKQAGQLVASEPAVLALAGNANNFTGAVPGLQAQLNELVRAMSASGAPSAGVQRAAAGGGGRFDGPPRDRNACRWQRRGDLRRCAGRDITVFSQVLDGLRNGNEELGITAVRGAAAVAALEQSQQKWER